MTYFAQAIIALDNLGLFDVILPFLFVFVVVYAMLRKTKITGQQHNIQLLIAFCCGFIFVSYEAYVGGLMHLLLLIALALVMIVVFLMIVGLTGASVTQKSMIIWGALGVMTLIVITTLFSDIWLYVQQLPATLIAPLVTILAFFGVIWFIVRDGSSKPKKVEETKGKEKKKEEPEKKRNSDSNTFLPPTRSPEKVKALGGNPVGRLIKQ
ncbi:MAG: hypothetical protein ACMXYC_04035 [Candidatus Woesearchaeota archaeon]